MGFRVHLVVYVLVSALLVVLNLVDAPEDIWFVWPVGGWGIGVLLHALNAYGFTAGVTDAMIRRKLENE
ncbi:MAG: 2TM domain-containing protein [Myxococcales bacterium]|nr:2TM domain-containing protein [Myxococcales bacterium]